MSLLGFSQHLIQLLNLGAAPDNHAIQDHESFYCGPTCLFHQKEHFYDYNVSGPDFPTYHKIVNEVSQHIGNLQVNFLNHNSVSERKLFSLQKIKNDILWEPKYSIERGIKDYIDNLA